MFCLKPSKVRISFLKSSAHMPRATRMSGIAKEWGSLQLCSCVIHAPRTRFGFCERSCVVQSLIFDPCSPLEVRCTLKQVTQGDNPITNKYRVLVHSAQIRSRNAG